MNRQSKTNIIIPSYSNIELSGFQIKDAVGKYNFSTGIIQFVWEIIIG